MKKIGLILISVLYVIKLSAQVGINTENPEATLHIEGNLKITNTPILPNATVLVVDTEGYVGTAANIPAKVMLTQSSKDQYYYKNKPADLKIIEKLNNSEPIVVEWESNDIKTNNIMSFNHSSNSFKFKQAGIYELSGYINYNGGGKVPLNLSTAKEGDRFMLTNVSIQLYNNTTNLWEDLASARYVSSDGGMGNISATIVIPPILNQFEKDDEIRMVFTRPFGVEHGSASATASVGIGAPTGIKFSKGMKVIAY